MGRGYGTLWVIVLAGGIPTLVIVFALRFVQAEANGSVGFGLTVFSTTVAVGVAGIALWLVPVASGLRFVRKRFAGSVVFIGRIDPSSSFRPGNRSGLTIVSVDASAVSVWSAAIAPSSLLQLNADEVRGLYRDTVELYGSVNVPALIVDGLRDSGFVELRIVPSNSAFRVLYPMGEREIDRLVERIRALEAPH
jgi:hypothetical protein